MRRTRGFAAAATLAAVATMATVAACSGGVSGQGQRSTATEKPAAAGNLAAALAVVPGSAGAAMAVDQAAMKKRWGLADVTSATDTDSEPYKDYLHHLSGYVAAGRLATLVVVMPDEYGWSWADVDWAVDISDPNAVPATVYKLRDSLDMSVVTTSMDKHYERSGPDTRPVYALDLKKGGSQLPVIGGAVVLPDKHLVIDSRDPAAVLAVVDGAADGFGTTGTANQMLTAVGDAEGVIVQYGAMACQNPVPQIIGTTAAPTAMPSGDPNLTALGTVTWNVVGVTDETHAVVAAGYPDAAAATADAPRRTKLVTEGQSPIARRDYADLLGPVTATAQDAQLTYRLDGLPTSTRLVNMWAQRDAPWAFCGAG